MCGQGATVTYFEIEHVSMLTFGIYFMLNFGKSKHQNLLHRHGNGI